MVRYNHDLYYGCSAGTIEIYEIMRIKHHHSVLSHSDIKKMLLMELIDSVGGKKLEIIFECDRKKDFKDDEKTLNDYVKEFFVFIKTFDYKVMLKRYRNKMIFNFEKDWSKKY